MSFQGVIEREIKNKGFYGYMLHWASNNNLLSAGNIKLSRKIGIWSLPAIETCPNCEQCKHDCYAFRSQLFKPDCDTGRRLRLFYVQNYTLAFKHRMIAEARTFKYVRIHESGDFYSQEYVDLWADIIRECPETIFYFYTKTEHIWDFTAIRKCKNVNMMRSLAIDGGLNFGNISRVKELVAMGHKLCPATVESLKNRKHKEHRTSKIHCGENCFYCLTPGNDKPCFIIH